MRAISGNERIFNIGLRIKLATARIAPAKINIGNFPENSTFFIVKAEIKIARELNNMRIINDINMIIADK